MKNTIDLSRFSEHLANEDEKKRLGVQFRPECAPRKELLTAALK